MILTFTPNPSNDATLELSDTLTRGAVLRPASARRSAGGKGINVAHALHLAGQDTLAVFPAAENDPFISLVKNAHVPFESIPIDGTVRTNTTITEPDGTTTKLNEPGARLNEASLNEINSRLHSLAKLADTLVFAGSLPPGAPVDSYAAFVRTARESNPDVVIAVDTSDKPLQQLGANFPDAAPDIIKPNGLELGQLTGHDGPALEKAAEEGDFSPALEAAKPLLDQGVSEVLLTLGGAGALLITSEGSWQATPPPTKVVSTVGAGDSSLAGYLLARTRGDQPAELVRMAVAYGSAATSLPGTQIPAPELINIRDTVVTQIAV